MGKLVLFLADGTTLDIRLDRERLTIGRRADNDVCLPYPAVSGEHAAVVTILSDSFLEDMGSTNGTLVNGKSVTKHFLRDHDQIDIGRQKFVYLADESMMLEPGTLALDRLERKLHGERVETAWVAPVWVAPKTGALPAPPVAAVAAAPPKVDVAPMPPIDEAPSGNASFAGGSMSDIAGFVAAEIGASRPRGNGISTRAIAEPPRPVPEDPPAAGPVIRVVTGPNAGREVPLDKDETTVGRVGVQVAAVRRADGEFRLLPLEGGTAPSVNGAPVPAEGQPLKAGDLLEIAGVRLEFVLPPGGADAK